MNDITKGFLKRNLLFIAKLLALIALFFALTVWLYFAYAPTITSMAPRAIGRVDVVAEEIARLESLGSFLSALFQGNLGYSLHYVRPVWSILVGSLGVTLFLIIISVAISTATVAVVALVAARFKPKDYMPLASAYSLRGYFFALTAWTGTIVLIIFAYHLGWIPSSLSFLEYWVIHPPENILVEIEGWLRHLVLPMLTLTIIFMIRSFFLVWSGGTRFTSGKMPKNLLLSLTVTDFAGIVSAVVLIEYTFGLGGIGSRLFTSVESGDLTLLVGAFIVLLAVATILGCVGVLLEFIRQHYGLPVKLEREVHAKADDMKVSAQNVSKIGLRSLLRSVPRKKSLFFGLAIVSLFVIIGLAAPLLTADDPSQPGIAERRAQPVWYKSLFGGDPNAASSGLLGTDMFGRDIFSQVVYGARNAFVITVPMAFVAALVGLALGFVADRFGNLIDNIVKLFADTTLVLPVVPLLFVASWTLQSSSLDWALLWVVSALAVVAFRSAYLAHVGDRMSRSYALRGRLLGLLKNFLANFCFVMASLTLLSLISSFGLYYQPWHELGFSTSTWSGMLSTALYPLFRYESWWLWVPPLSSILLLATGFLLIGIGLDKRLWFTPKTA